MAIVSGLITKGGNALVTASGAWLVINTLPAPPPPPPPKVSRGHWRLLKDHYVNDTLIPGGTIIEMFAPWSPTADCEPLDATALALFYAAGPRLGACIRTQFAGRYINFPITFWTPAGPNSWKLTGLGANLSPIVANVSNIEDKGP